jgi:hypothetical protein
MFSPDTNYTGGKLPVTILFNKQNGMYITYVVVPLAMSQHDDTLYEAREAMFDHALDVIQGQLTKLPSGLWQEDWKVILRSELPEEVYEHALNLQAEQKITKRYPIVDQINLVVAALQRLAKEHDLNDHPEFQALAEMTSYTAQVLETNAAKKEFYRDHPDVIYISDEQREAETSARMEGGIHEALGPRDVTGGSVFGTQRH